MVLDSTLLHRLKKLNCGIQMYYQKKIIISYLNLSFLKPLTFPGSREDHRTYFLGSSLREGGGEGIKTRGWQCSVACLNHGLHCRHPMWVPLKSWLLPFVPGKAVDSDPIPWVPAPPLETPRSSWPDGSLRPFGESTN